MLNHAARSIRRTALLAALLSAIPLSAEERVWSSRSFLDFIDGTLSDGGVNTYVAADGTIRLINLWDLNQDGNFDIPIACGQDHNEEVDLFIYWADDIGFNPNRRTRLPTAGAIGVCTADLNDDGHVDLIVANRFDGEKTNLDTYIYWGSVQGFVRHTVLNVRTQSIAVGDYNHDGLMDIYVANPIAVGDHVYIIYHGCITGNGDYFFTGKKGKNAYVRVAKRPAALPDGRA